VVRYSPSKYKALSSIPTTTKPPKKQKQKQKPKSVNLGFNYLLGKYRVKHVTQTTVNGIENYISAEIRRRVEGMKLARPLLKRHLHPWLM
jgi:hypothetical protein